jgi:hypothetical protein
VGDLVPERIGVLVADRVRQPAEHVMGQQGR